MNSAGQHCITDQRQLGNQLYTTPHQHHGKQEMASNADHKYISQP